jgi:hypothetical protein
MPLGIACRIDHGAGKGHQFADGRGWRNPGRKPGGAAFERCAISMGIIAGLPEYPRDLFQIALGGVGDPGEIACGMLGVALGDQRGDGHACQPAMFGDRTLDTLIEVAVARRDIAVAQRIIIGARLQPVFAEQNANSGVEQGALLGHGEGFADHRTSHVHAPPPSRAAKASHFNRKRQLAGQSCKLGKREVNLT